MRWKFSHLKKKLAPQRASAVAGTQHRRAVRMAFNAAQQQR
jgi:hypothetical protein